MIPDPRTLIAAALDCASESIDADSRLGHHPAWDSVGHLGVMLALEQHYGIAISDETIRRYDSLEAIAALYRSMV
ncbi:hypothetical protein MCP1_240019 [Candidatus Terasakiella magnetica]|nr:hypothetical protein MCP1_240019 [Candidatus Terasakiella magnetica]